MFRIVVMSLAGLAVMFAASGHAFAQAPASPPKAATAADAPAAAPKAGTTSDAAPKSEFDLLKGAWVRPDGGYTIAIASVAANGQLDAIYYNPGKLPFAKALAVREGMTTRISLELRAGGYNGSTYELVYDRVTDRLKGIYYQAVAQQKFEVYFVRK
ncbi:MAG: hypothetical protein ABI724_09700 [Betaproteobacteria bacterium]